MAEFLEALIVFGLCGFYFDRGRRSRCVYIYREIFQSGSWQKITGNVSKFDGYFRVDRLCDPILFVLRLILLVQY